MGNTVLHLSSMLGCSLVDRAGEKLGRVEDFIVRLGGDAFPPVMGVRARIGGRELFVPADSIASLAPGCVQLAGEVLNLGRFTRRQGEVLLGEDVLGRKLVDVEQARLVTAHEILLMSVEDWWHVVAVDPHPRARLRRWLPGGLKKLIKDGPFADWRELEPFVGHVPTARLRFSYRKLAKLHPAQIADLVEAASHEEGEELIKAVGHDHELEADVFEELDDEHQREFIHERSDAEVAQVLSRMETDDAADLIADLDQERREPVLTQIPAEQQRRVRSLLGYNPKTAGGLMSPDVIWLNEDSSVADALAEVRKHSDWPPELVGAVFTKDSDGLLSGLVTLGELVQASEQQLLSELITIGPVFVDTGADVPEIAVMMSDYDLGMLPVVKEGELVGVITFDDILEEVLPDDWRRRYGRARD